MRETKSSLWSIVALMLLTACATAPVEIPRNATIGGAQGPLRVPAAQNAARPILVGVHFSSLRVKRGERWSGDFVTSTNVASVEVRTPLFSIDVPRTSFGRFAFTLDVLDAPPIFIRPYRLEVIARNAAGIAAREELPFEIQ